MCVLVNLTKVRPFATVHDVTVCLKDKLSTDCGEKIIIRIKRKVSTKVQKIPYFLQNYYQKPYNNLPLNNCDR